MHSFNLAMRPLRIRRRPDGVIELRRPRLRDAVVTPDAAILLALFVGSLAFMVLVAVMAVASPGLVVVPGSFALLGLWAGSFARKVRLETASAEASPPPPRAG
jgi:hypothetical protein